MVINTSLIYALNLAQLATALTMYTDLFSERTCSYRSSVLVNMQQFLWLVTRSERSSLIVQVCMQNISILLGKV